MNQEIYNLARQHQIVLNAEPQKMKVYTPITYSQSQELAEAVKEGKIKFKEQLRNIDMRDLSNKYSTEFQQFYKGLKTGEANVTNSLYAVAEMKQQADKIINGSRLDEFYLWDREALLREGTDIDRERQEMDKIYEQKLKKFQNERDTEVQDPEIQEIIEKMKAKYQEMLK